MILRDARVLWVGLLSALVPAAWASPTLVATLPVGPRPVGVAMNPRTHRVYVADASGALFIIDGSARKVLGTVSVGGQPSAVAVDPRTNRVYLAQADPSAPALSALPGEGGAAAAVLPAGRSVSALAVHPVGARLFVGDAAAPEVVMLNAAEDTVLQVISVSGPVVALAVDQSANRLYVSVGGERPGVDVIDLASMALAHRPLPGGAPRHLIVDPHNDRLYADCAEPPLLLAMAGPAASPAGALPLPAAAMGLALDSQTGRVYASHGELRQMTVVDGPAMKPLPRAEMADHYEAIVVDPQMKPAQIYLASPSGTLAIMTDP
jgi:YVTN family beta-propeller protein